MYYAGNSVTREASKRRLFENLFQFGCVDDNGIPWDNLLGRYRMGFPVTGLYRITLLRALTTIPFLWQSSSNITSCETVMSVFYHTTNVLYIKYIRTVFHHIMSQRRYIFILLKYFSSNFISAIETLLVFFKSCEKSIG